MSDFIINEGRKYYAEGYLTSAINTAQRRGKALHEIAALLGIVYTPEGVVEAVKELKEKTDTLTCQQ